MTLWKWTNTVIKESFFLYKVSDFADIYVKLQYFATMSGEMDSFYTTLLNIPCEILCKYMSIC